MVGDEHHHSNSAFGGPGSAALRLALYAVTAVLLMAADHRTGYLDGLRQKLSVLVYPLLQAVNLPAKAGRWIGQSWSDRRLLIERNQELEQRWLTSQVQLNRMAVLEQENQRLRALLDSSTALGERVLVAELLAVDLDPYSHRVVLNKGAYHGVYAGQPLADSNGIVGQIESVSEFNAFAMLISDPSHAIPVTINRTGLRTIAYGNGLTDQLLLQDISASANVIQGDLLVTSGLGGRFPRGFPVARVMRVSHDPGAAFLSVIARPTAALDRSREVLLVWPEQRVSTDVDLAKRTETVP